MVHEAGDFLQLGGCKVGEAVRLVSSVVVPEVDLVACGFVEFDKGFS